MDQVGQCLRQRDADGASRAVHTLKGTIGVFHALPAMTAAANVEAAARRGDIEAAIEAFSELNTNMEQLTHLIRRARQC
jgi:hypothetical protein